MEKCPKEFIFSSGEDQINRTVCSLEVPKFILSTETKGFVIVFHVAAIIRPEMLLKVESEEG